ncbi:MAG: PilN domain-containing protein [Limnobacter sp.]|uniref:PilN domain-containing protein n=1 Tax=Limnobacter sp. TaxID=2003368 RepID=UPI00391BFA28
MRVILFNLAPYRAHRYRLARLRTTATLAAAVVVALLIPLCVSLDLSEREAAQTAYMEELGTVERQIADRVAKVQTLKDEMNRLQNQVDALEDVERKSLRVSRMFSYLEATMPGQVGLKSLTMKEGDWSVSGYTDSVPQFAEWVQGMEKEGSLLKDVRVKYLRQVDAQNPNAGPANSASDKAASPHEFELAIKTTELRTFTPASQELAHGRIQR